MLMLNVLFIYMLNANLIFNDNNNNNNNNSTHFIHILENLPVLTRLDWKWFV